MGALGIIIAARRKGIRLLPVLDAIAPTVLVAQAIGRWGNWFNQELFGKPTDLPWGLEIDTDRRPDAYIFDSTFHPTFLYEALWNLAAAALLLVLDSRFRFRPPALFALYVSLYTGFRLYLESLRIDPSEHIAGLRVNSWMSLILFVLSTSFFVYWQFFRGRRDERGRRSSKRVEPKTAMAVPRGRVRPRR
jgi:prolipoprotein diacylglyceryl transferase